eukprot:8398904-Pyramimonas_sp.AAC.1
MLPIRAGHRNPLFVVTLGSPVLNMAAVSSGNFVCGWTARKSQAGAPPPMGPAAHVTNPSGPSEPV